MYMYGNPFWKEAAARWDAFWNVSYVDRPGIQIWYPAESSRPPSGRNWTTWERWNDPEAIIEQNRETGNSCLGEAIRTVCPFWYGIEETLGIDLNYTPDTTWVHPMKGSLSDVDLSRFTSESPSFARLLNIMSQTVQALSGEYFCSYPPLGNPGDTMARIRSYEAYCYDLMDEPELAFQKETELTDIWCELYRRVMQTLLPVQEGSCGWLPAWYKGKSFLIEFDFCALVSPELFKSFIPMIEKRASETEKTIFHLDGPDSLKHLDVILSLPWIDAVQALPGAGIPDMLLWMPIYKKIQAAGKSLYVGNSVSAEEARVLIKELRPEGLMIPIHFGSRDNAFKFAEDYNVTH
ncbi:hypothetical protein FACS1894219_06580 [Clostridia bacterium]|nr:hypothetical protein FACS1894219_06580 [Clostridia bacterium]